MLSTAEASDRRSALGQLCTLYWAPVYGFILSRTVDEEAAKDLTQAFFTRLLEKGDLAPSRQDGVRFRSYLAGCIRHFLANEADRERAQRRGGDWARVPLALGDGQADGLNPERIFERRWATQVVEHALERVKGRYRQTGLAAEFDRLEVFLLGSKADCSYQAVALDLGMTEGAVKMAVHRLRKRFGNALRQEVARTVGDESAVEEELRYLLTVLSD